MVHCRAEMATQQENSARSNVSGIIFITAMFVSKEKFDPFAVKPRDLYCRYNVPAFEGE